MLKNEIVKRDHEINSLKNEIDEISHNLTDAFSRLDEKENEIETIEADKVYLQKDLDEMRNDLDSKYQELNRALKLYDQKNIEAEKVSREAKTLQGKYNNLEKQVKNFEEKNRELNNSKIQDKEEITDLRKNLDLVNHELNRYKGETQCLEALKQNLEKERDRTIAEYVECRNMTELMRREKDKYTDENKALKTEVLEQKEALNETRKETRVLEDRNAELKRALLQYERDGEDIVDENTRLKNENQLLDAKLTRMQNETLAEVTEKYTESVKLRAELDAVKNELRKRNKAERQSSLASSDENPSSESSHKREVVLLKAQIEKISEEEAKMKSELNMTKNKFSIYMKDRYRLESELKEKSQELEREKSNTQNLEREKNLLQSKIDRLKLSNSKRMESVGGEYKYKLNYLEQQIKAIKTTHSLEIEAKKVEIDSLSRQLQLLRATENSRKFSTSDRSDVLLVMNKTEQKNYEQELDEMKAKYRLKSKLYEREIEFINLKYNLVIAQNEDDTTQVNNILEDMTFIEQQKQKLNKEWNENFGDGIKRSTKL